MNAKRLLIKIAKGIGIVLGAILLYILCAILLPYIEVSEDKTNDPKDYTIYILTNGVHTDLVLPIKNDVYDWTTFVSPNDTKSKDQNFNYLAVGWGDKGFYLDTPTWADLKASTAFKAAFWLSDSAMHCTFYKDMKEGDDCKKISLTKKQYTDLLSFIKSKFDVQADRPKLIVTDAVYGTNDAFYDAVGSYSFLNTCNTWSNDALKASGQKAAFWTATDKGIFQHYK